MLSGRRRWRGGRRGDGRGGRGAFGGTFSFLFTLGFFFFFRVFCGTAVLFVIEVWN